jgi:hypothetical protein
MLGHDGIGGATQFDPTASLDEPARPRRRAESSVLAYKSLTKRRDPLIFERGLIKLPRP